jgi:predicted permease
MASTSSLLSTFVASLQSVGTAATLAAGGFYLHQRGFVSNEGRKALARYGQQVAVPALFFSRLIVCGPQTDTENCPSVWDQMRQAWVLFVWPFYVIALGLVVGFITSVVSKTPRWQWTSVMASVALCNSFSLPITLLSVIEESHLVQGDPTQYLTIYVILHPIIMWSVGGLLLAPVNSDKVVKASDSLPVAEPESHLPAHHDPLATEESLLLKLQQGDSANDKITCKSFLRAAVKSASKALQPPVVASVTGLVVAAIPPLRFLLTSSSSREEALLEWFLRGLVSIGRSAVPVSMAILGINLSMTAAEEKQERQVSYRTLAAVVVSRMLIMPIIGVLSVTLLNRFFFRSADTALYLVLMIEFITPTANTVLLMAELAECMRSGMATILAYQYLISPILLTLSVAMVLHVATKL